MPPAKISSETLHQMLLDTRSDFARMQLQLDSNSKVCEETGRRTERIDSKLDRALTLEAAVVEMRSDLDRAKGMGILGGMLLAALEGLVGIVAFFRGH